MHEEPGPITETGGICLKQTNSPGIARIASKLLVLNYPCRESLPAQQLMLQLTNNAFVKEHVEWELPDSDWVMSELTALGFECQLVCHTNAGIWLGQYLVQNLLPDVAPLLNSALIADHSTEPFSIPLYHLVVAKRPG